MFLLLPLLLTPAPPHLSIFILYWPGLDFDRSTMKTLATPLVEIIRWRGCLPISRLTQGSSVFVASPNGEHNLPGYSIEALVEI